MLSTDKQTDRQTDRQTNQRYQNHNLLCQGGKNYIFVYFLYIYLFIYLVLHLAFILLSHLCTPILISGGSFQEWHHIVSGVRARASIRNAYMYTTNAIINNNNKQQNIHFM